MEGRGRDGRAGVVRGGWWCASLAVMFEVSNLGLLAGAAGGARQRSTPGLCQTRLGAPSGRNVRGANTAQSSAAVDRDMQ